MIAAILVYIFLRHAQQSEENDGGLSIRLTIGLWGSIVMCCAFSAIFLRSTTVNIGLIETHTSYYKAKPSK